MDHPPKTDPDDESGPSVPPPAPRWVKVFGIVAAVLVVLFVIVHLTGHGFRHTM